MLLEWKECVVLITYWFWACLLCRARQFLQDLHHKPQSSNLMPVSLFTHLLSSDNVMILMSV